MSTLITPERLELYASAAASFGDLDGLLATITQIRADRTTLEREGRTTAAKGARRLLAGVVRRLCATLALSDVEAAAKIDMLATVGQDYRESQDDMLTVVMVDAAIGLETRQWFTASPRH